MRSLSRLATRTAVVAGAAAILGGLGLSAASADVAPAVSALASTVGYDTPTTVTAEDTVTDETPKVSNLRGGFTTLAFTKWT